MSHDPHLGSVIAAYALALVVVGGMIGAIVADYMRLTRALSLLSEREKHHGPEFQQIDGKGLNRQELDQEGLD